MSDVAKEIDWDEAEKLTAILLHGMFGASAAEIGLTARLIIFRIRELVEDAS